MGVGQPGAGSYLLFFFSVSLNPLLSGSMKILGEFGLFQEFNEICENPGGL